MTAIDSEQVAGPLVYSPAEAATRISGTSDKAKQVISEAWLRRKAGQRLIPCTRFMGRLGFTEANLADIVAQFHVPAKSRLARH